MKSIQMAAALMLPAILTGLNPGALAAGRQDDPFEKLKTYDYQNRQPVEAIRLMIDQAAGKREPLAQIEDKLDSVLGDGTSTFAAKQEAARFLWIIGTNRSVPVLSPLLTDEKLSDVARYALERNAAPGAGKALEAALPAAHGRILVGIINSLGDRGDASAVPSLKPYVMDSDPLVAEAATIAIGKTGAPAAVAVLRALPADSVTAGIALRRAAEKLAQQRQTAAAARVYEILWSPNRPSSVRGEAVRGLANIGARNAPTVALAALKSSDPYLQTVSAQVIGSLNDNGTIARAVADWSSLPMPAQVALLTVLAEKRDAAAAGIARTAVGSSDPALRSAGIRAEGRVGGAAAVPSLIQTMIHGEGADRNTAREALAGLRGADAEKAILDQVRHAEPATRIALAGVLVDRPTPAAEAALLEMAQGSDPGAAAAAIRAIGRAGGASERGALIKLLLTTGSDEVRDSAKDAILAIGQRSADRESAVAPVLTAYATATGPARSALLGIMAETGGEKALDELTRAAASNDAELRQAAVRAMAETWPDTRALPALLAIAKSDPNKNLRVQALRGYIRLVGQDDSMRAEDKVARMTDALSAAERPEEKRQALSVLRDARTPGSVALAAKYLSEPDLFSDATDTILYLAAAQRKNNRNLPAVKGDATSAALDTIIKETKDDAQRSAAQKLK